MSDFLNKKFTGDIIVVFALAGRVIYLIDKQKVVVKNGKLMQNNNVFSW